MAAVKGGMVDGPARAAIGGGAAGTGGAGVAASMREAGTVMEEGFTDAARGMIVMDAGHGRMNQIIAALASANAVNPGSTIGIHVRDEDALPLLGMTAAGAPCRDGTAPVWRSDSAFLSASRI